MNAREKVVAANWKMHKVVGDVTPYLRSFLDRRKTAATVKTIFFAPAPLLAHVVAEVGSAAEVGGQNVHWEPAGAFTGEVSVDMLRSLGVEHVLVGHSERRHLFGETDDECRRKIRAALDGGLQPMLCVGETLDEREAGRQQAVVVGQLSRAVDGLSREEYGRLRIAYEPVWAIGTGRTATPGDAQTMHASIRRALSSIAGPEAAQTMPILYGGSVKPDNVVQLMNEPDIDGVLVGGASLDASHFAAIANGAGSLTSR